MSPEPTSDLSQEPAAATPESPANVPPPAPVTAEGAAPPQQAPPAPPGEGPLARFRRGASPSEQQPAAPPKREGRPKGQRGNQDQPRPRPAGGVASGQPAERPKSRRDKEKEEDAQVERELAAEKGARDDTAPRPHVPVPNIRQRMDDIEAEVEAALGGISLDDIVAGDLKTVGERLENDSRHRAQVVEVHGDDVFFALGGKNQGMASVRSFAEPPQPGQMVDVIVTGFNAEDNLYSLSIPGGSIVAGDWTDIAEGSLVEARVTGANTGGLECQVANIRAFIPASQVSLYRVENLAEFIGQKLVCVVTESNERRGNLVVSRRAVLEREKEESKKALLSELQPGQFREGTVRKLHDFGAFVDLGGVDGLVHVSQLSWERVKHPSEVVQEGQKVRVRIEKIDEATGKISLSLKNPEEHPWAGIESKFPVGSVVRGPVTRTAQFGAFVRLAPGVEGLIHVSELAHHKVYRVENVVKEGEEVECKVLSVDRDAQRIGLSLKATLAKPEQAAGKPKTEEPDDAPPRPVAVPKRSGPLKGGTGKATGGEQFGLKW